MNKTFFYRSPLVLAFIALVLCLMGIWWGSPVLEGHARLYISLGLFLLWAGYSLWIFQQSRLSKNSRSDQLHLEQNFRKAVDQQNLADLPHYLILGPNGAGKTSLIANSGFEFILTDQQKSLNKNQLPPTEDCDFWVSQEAVFMDIGRDYTIHNHLGEAPKMLWKNLLRLLHKARKKLPIKGIIVVLSLPELVEWSRSKKARYENNIHQRIDELNQLFRGNIPVYLCLSKCDQVEGFQDFFETLSPEEQRQILGIHLSSQTVERGFENLMQGIHSHMLQRLQQEQEVGLRARLLPFPWRLSHYKLPLLQFIQNTFEGDQTVSSLNLQGVYLTSSQQQLPHKSYFIEQPLRHMISQGVAATSIKPKFLLDQRLLQRLFAALCGGLIIACATYWSLKLSDNIKVFNQTHYDLGLYQAYSTNSQNQKDPASLVPVLNQLVELKQTVDHLRPFWPLASLYQDVFPETVIAIFNQELQTRFLPAVDTQLAHENLAGKDSLKVYWEQRYPGQTVLTQQLEDYLQLALATNKQVLKPQEQTQAKVATAAPAVITPEALKPPKTVTMPKFNPPADPMPTQPVPVVAAPIKPVVAPSKIKPKPQTKAKPIEKVINTPYGTITLGG